MKMKKNPLPGTLCRLRSRDGAAGDLFGHCVRRFDKYIQSYYYPTKTLIGEELPYNQLSDQNGNPARLRSAKISTPSSPIGPAGARTARRSSPTCPSCSRFWMNMKMCSGT